MPRAASPGGVAALDAGCGRTSSLRPLPRPDRAPGRRRTSTQPDEPLTHLDEFAIVDLCGPADGVRARLVRRRAVVLHARAFRGPGRGAREHAARGSGRAARSWRRPVNRRHPFVGAYLALPDRARARGPAVGEGDGRRCASARRGVQHAGGRSGATSPRPASASHLQTVGHLARAWGRHLPTFLLGLTGDLLDAGPAVAPLDDRGRRPSLSAAGRQRPGPHVGPRCRSPTRAAPAPGVCTIPGGVVLENRMHLGCMIGSRAGP